MSRRIAALGGLVVIAAALVVAAGSASSGAATGHLDWGVRLAFRNYVTGPIAKGSISASDGATVNGDGTFRFPQLAGAQFGGKVRFVGHDGQLDLTISNPRIDGTALRLDVVSLPLGETEFEVFDDVAFAALALVGTPTAADNVAATLTADGSLAFADFYPEGTPLDPVSYLMAETPDTTSTAPDATSTSSTAAPAPTTTTVAPESPPTITGGHLDWGVKLSFRNYINGPIARGSITTSGGATVNADGTFHFPATASGFSGIVHFTGHEGQLDLTLSDLRVSGSALIADVVSLPLGETTPATFDDIVFASLAQSIAPPGAANVAATLTAEGAQAFAEFYAAGTALDPVTVVLETSDGSGGGGGSGGAGATTTTTAPGVTVDKSSVMAGGAMTVAGGGFLAGEQVEVWIHSDPVFLTTVVAGPNGVATATVTIPANTPAGTHTIELRGISSGRVVTSAAFTVTAASASALPRTGGSGGLVWVALVSFGAGLSALAASRVRHRSLAAPSVAPLRPHVRLRTRRRTT